MQQRQTWRSMLGDIIEEPGERQRIAKEIGIVPITLTRWAKNDGVPRLYLLAPLIQAVPEKDRERLRTLMKEEFPGFSDDLASFPEKATGAPEELLSPEAARLLKTLEEETQATREEDLPPKYLYAHVLEVFTSTRPDERFWQLCTLILPHALKQLDPHGAGVELIVARCLPSSQDGEIHSLREAVGVGSPPWNSDLEEKQFLLGTETLAGYVVSSRHQAVIQNKLAPHYLPVLWKEHEQSAAISPILQADSVAGALICSSTHIDYFGQSRQTLLGHYANLLALTFRPNEFYPPQNITLRSMPSIQVQQKHFVHFQARIAQKMARAMREGHPMTFLEAEHATRQELVEEFTQLTPAAERGGA